MPESVAAPARRCPGREAAAAKTRREKIEALLLNEDPYAQQIWEYNGFRATSAMVYALLEIADALTDIAVAAGREKGKPHAD
jgi:hypothetical protein